MSSSLVPFTAREWQIVKDSYNKHGNDLILATEILTMWRARQGTKTPVIFQITDHLLHIDRLNADTNFRDDYSVRTLINNYSSVLVRVINYLSEICQCQEGVSSIASAVATIGVPDWIVDIRHRAAHNHLPPLDMFIRACETLRQLIWDKYWSKSIEEAMRWAVPKTVYENEQNRCRILKQKEKACTLIHQYVQWKNEKPNNLTAKSEFKDIPILCEIEKFIKESPDTMIAFLSSDVLVLSEEKAEHYGFATTLTEGIFEIPNELQTYWASILILIDNNQKSMELVIACLKCMYEDVGLTLFQKKSLAGWVELLLDVLLRKLRKGVQISNNESGQWRKIVKCMLNSAEDFKASTIIDVFKTTKIFNEKKTSQLVRLINLRARDSRISKTAGADDVLRRSLSTSSKNLSHYGKNLNSSVSFLNDTNEGGEWAIADIDFTNVPLGLMPNQMAESLYLIIEED